MNKKTLFLISGITVVIALIPLVLYSMTSENLPLEETILISDRDAFVSNNIDDTSATAFAINMSQSATAFSEITAANNAFAIDFLKQVSTDGKNVFFSPTSIYTAFSSTYEGALDNTAKQIQTVFGINPDMTERHNATAYMMASLNRDDPDIILELANSLWIANWFEPDESYLKTARSTYLASVEKVNLLDDGIDRINDWASDKTRGKIPKVLEPGSLDGSTAMVLLNAIYFKGAWALEFPEGDTRQSEFWKTSNQSIDADFMNIQDTFAYAHSDGAQVLKIPYKGDRLSMLVILPDDIDGMEQLQENLSPEVIRKWQHSLITIPVMVSMPKFEIKTHYDLTDILTTLGIHDAFHPLDANLLGILGIQSGEEYHGKNLYLSQALHDAYVKVTEEGTEAAAVTTIMTIEESSGSDYVLSFTANHPFIFAIQDNESGMILFMGMITDPTQTQS